MKKTHLLKFILSYGKGKKWLVACALIFTLGAVASSLLLPVLIGNAIDFLVGVGQVDFVKILIQLVYIICAIAVGFLCQWLASICANSLSYYITQGVRNDFFAHLNKLPLSTIDGAKHGEIVSRLTTDVETIGAGLLQGFSSLFSGVITIAGTLGLMFFINPIIAGVVVLLTPLSIIFAMFIAKRVHTQFAKQAKIQGEITAFTQEKLGGQKTIKAFGQEQSCQQSFKDINDKLYECGLKAQLYSAFVNPTTRFINNIIYAIVGVIGAVLAVFFGKITAGTLTTFLLYSNHYTKPFNEISGVIAELQSAFASAQRVDDFLKLALESSDSDCATLDKGDGKIVLDNISFGYTPQKTLINNLSLEIKPGQKVAIIGKTGCGKTTFINLIMRFYDVNCGQILISGQPINTITRRSLRSQFGMVLQDSWLFAGSVKDNIAFGRPGASLDEIVAAARNANADEFIQKLQDGYDTQVQVEGQNFSQGQRQLLCLARIMLTMPPMLILDEATSNIDTRTEAKINAAFERLLEGKTSIVVAHRLTTIKSADIILVMKDGDIVERGDHKTLLSYDSYYKQLYYSQYDADSDANN